MTSSFNDWALSKFSGCDNGELEAGTNSEPSIWLLGIEHGTYKSINDPNYIDEDKNSSYSIERQMKWPYNQKAFKLLAAIHPKYSREDYRKFAIDEQPFVTGTKGYFKGNLFPYPCHSQKSWGQQAIDDTGFSSKNEYIDWCKNYRLPKISKWIDEHRPRIIIGVGLSHKDTFFQACFGEENFSLIERKILDGQKQRIFLAKSETRKLVVTPHFSGRWGLNSNLLIERLGQIIADFISE